MSGVKPLDLKAEVLTRGVEDIVTRDELSGLLKSGKKFRIKHGIDATSPDLHLGHAANLWKLRALQEAGHKAVILLGDVTTLIGDPTGRVKARPILPQTAINRNIGSIRKQLTSILLANPAVLEIRRSSEWYKKLNSIEFLKLLSMVTNARLRERDMFRRREKEGNEIRESEIVYPVLQGYDSVMLKSDLTVIGSDQLFNEHMGRYFQEKAGMRPQVIITLRILPGLDGGEKMSKSLGNHISLLDGPLDKFRKVMSLRDELIVSYLESYTDVPPAQIISWKKDLQEGRNPMEAKLFLAEALVARYHGKKVAQRERKSFLALFSQKDISYATPVLLEPGDYDVLDLLQKIKWPLSRSEGRRLIEQRAVEKNNEVLDAIGIVRISEGDVIRIGKKIFVKVKWSKLK